MKNKNRTKKKVSKRLPWLIYIALVLCVAAIVAAAYMYKEKTEAFVVCASLAVAIFLVVVIKVNDLRIIAENYEDTFKSSSERIITCNQKLQELEKATSEADLKKKEILKELREKKRNLLFTKPPTGYNFFSKLLGCQQD